MPDLIITRDEREDAYVRIWSANATPVLIDGHFTYLGVRDSHLFTAYACHFPDLPPGHSARLVLADITDHRPVPKIEWVTVGCIDTATLGELTAFVRPQHTEYFLGATNDGTRELKDMAGLKTRAAAREWCEAELRKAVAK